MNNQPMEKMVFWAGAAGLLVLGVRLVRLLAVAAYLARRNNGPGKLVRQDPGA